jgi:tRNA(Arg) A34 adenosine deaminase TadA
MISPMIYYDADYEYNYDFERNIHKQDEHLLSLCIEVAKKSNMRCQHGCIIQDNKGNIISSACNKSNNLRERHIQDVEKRPLFSKHAEETALKNVDKTKLKGAKLYVVRWNNMHNCFMNSKPCTKCTSIIQSYMNKYGLKVAYYSTNEELLDEI